jgi:hypothetical protein
MILVMGLEVGLVQLFARIGLKRLYELRQDRADCLVQVVGFLRGQALATARGIDLNVFAAFMWLGCDFGFRHGFSIPTGQRGKSDFALGVPRYRALKPFPDVLEYRNARVTIERYHRVQWDGENLACFRENNRGSFIVLISGTGDSPIEKQLAEGFEVNGRPGSAIMESLVAKGYAERMD